ncbi:ATP-binding cassette domain-containing protein [Streptomyces sp. ACA25]|uniref:ABC transporter ATP-binding protein n=1 Tax=Streptomyces sp. ACA25 TaxID=3022596 RepID=UPI0023075EB0|nr:ATP-binding cassette domain-containing protein [Streptomyces sp. ACA25]MDB1087488.1 ATP-binding cassette domain-containing protein [Streptomyces sp. ACA25]
MTPVLEIDDVELWDSPRGTRLPCPRFTLAAGEAVVLAGPSGAGKTTVLHLLLAEPRAGVEVVAGAVRWEGTPLPPAGTRAARRWRSRHVGYLAQDPAGTLDPLRRAGRAVAEGLPPGTRRRDRARRSAELLTRLGLPEDAARRLPHQLSGGQAQRVALARAVAGRPRLLLLDEPTSGLDEVSARLVAAELGRHLARGGVAVVVSHDRDWAAGLGHRVVELRAAPGGGADPVAVLRNATALPQGTAGGAAGAPPRRPAAPRPTRTGPVGDPAVEVPPPGAPGEDGTVLRTHDLTIGPPGGSGEPLLSGVGLVLRRGELVALLGPSGSGKSTLLKTLAGLHPPAAGRALLHGTELAMAGPDGRPAARDRATRAAVQLLGQDPDAELNPAHRLLGAVARPVRVLRGASRQEARQVAAGLLAEVGLDSAVTGRRPGACSGGQRQRAALARSLAAEPAVLLADEPTSALDAATAAALLDALDRRRALGTAVLMVTHDVAVAARADRVHVLDGGTFTARIPGPAPYPGAAVPARQPFPGRTGFEEEKA